ncbi:MAG TPA: sortase [Rubrobacter sp.]|nr:sortase [Rubrobacter sp.]
MRGRFGWIGAGVLLLGIVAVLAFGVTALGGTNLLAGSDDDQTERAVEPTGAKKDPPKAAQEPEKEVTRQEEPKKDEPGEELSNEEQAEIADSFSAPEEVASASASASASAEASAPASAPADTTMSLSVPSIGLSTTVYEGTGEDSLSAATGHLSGTGYPWIPGSNTYIAGHRLGYPGTGSDHVFWDLPSVAIGDPVSLTDANGRTYNYAVTEILEVPITDLSVTEPIGSDVVSLQTCIEDYGDYWTAGPNWKVRYVVRAEKV